MTKRSFLIASFWASVVLFTAMSACFLLMPLAVSVEYGSRERVFALGASFWATALLGYLGVMLGSIVGKRICQEERIRLRGLPGVLSFASNLPALLFDVGLLISIVLLSVALLTPMSETYFAYVSIALTAFFFHMHALFNGKNYHMISKRHKRRGKRHGHFEK